MREAQPSPRGGALWFLDDVPSDRFPLYCRGNVGEIIPEVATPLSASFSTPAFRSIFSSIFGSTGVFSDDELADPVATGGLFGGYLYFNISMMRTFALRVPGMKPADVDTQMLGSSAEVPPHRAGPGDRALRRLPAIGIGLVRTMRTRRTPDLPAERADAMAWVASIPTTVSDSEVVDLVTTAAARFARDLESLLVSSMGGGISVGMLERVAGRAVRDEPGILVKALSGLGTIETAGPAIELWRLGRLVRESPTLTAAFDSGASGVVDRLRGAGETSFLGELDAFLATFGHRGPNEVELASETWGTSPEIVLAAIDRLRFAPDSVDPVVAAARLSAERADAVVRIERSVLPPLRPVLRRMLAVAGRGAANREIAKGTLVLQLAGLRRALFQVADRLVDAGVLPDRRSLFMVTVEELPGFLAAPDTLVDEIAARRRRYDELNALEPPFFFEGAIPDPSTWRPRTSEPDEGVPRVEHLEGIGVSAGVARGRARIVRSPADPRGIEPGDVLVAPITDPAWTPLFLAAAAVVVDVGAMQSHAAIVARELGVPAVVSVDGATRLLRDGDEIEVDGSRGIVTVLRDQR